MLQELADATAQVDLGLHAGKTKVLFNVAEEYSKEDKIIQVGGRKVEILARTESTMYLDGPVASRRRKTRRCTIASTLLGRSLW